MVLRGSLRRIVVGVVVAGAVLVPLSISSATTSTVSNNAKTLYLSLPGPLNGCTFLDAGANASTNAVLDLTRPSAFLTNASGQLYGAGGPIASAELTSLSPEVVRYTITANEQWSTGAAFSGHDLVVWWHRARTLSSVLGDGYRAIKSLVVAKDGLRITATFASPYADWNLLFRDVEAAGSTPGCAMGQLVARPSLGPYRIFSASSRRIELVMNSTWPVDANRFGRIVVTDAGMLPSSPTTSFVNFTLDVSRAQVQTLSSHPTVLSHIGASSNIEEVSFAPTRPFTSRLAIREALSWSFDRQSLINQLWGAVTFSPSVAVSAVYSQGQSAYPGTGGTGPTNLTTTTLPATNVTPGLADCLHCALMALTKNGFHRTSTGWATLNGFPLVVRLCVGPTGVDEAVATSIVHQWAHIGIATNRYEVASARAAARATATNVADVAIFARPTLTAASYTARSWSGVPFADSYPSGWRAAVTTTLFHQAISNFNPVAASTTWLSLDQQVMGNFWVRPLFTSPSLLEWSNTVSTINPTLSVPGLVDALPGWTTATPAGS